MENRTILIVNDDPRMQDFGHDCTREEPFSVQVTSDSSAARAFLQNNAVHIILIDVDLPGNQGQALLKQVQQQYPEAIRLVMSNRANIDFVLTAASEGNVYRYLIKPLEDCNALKLLLKQREYDNIYRY